MTQLKTTSQARDFERVIEKTTDNYLARRRRIVQDFMTDINRHLTHTNRPPIPLHLPAYSVEEYVPLVQDFFDTVYPSDFRLCVFDERANYKPIYKGCMDARQELGIVHIGDHFHGIRKISRFFSREFYCVRCERPYRNDKEHNLSCRSRCINCCEVGYGMQRFSQQMTKLLIIQDAPANRREMDSFV